MSALSPPRHRLVERALTDARTWCAGRIIDDRPALVHAVWVAATLDRHLPTAGRQLLAAALLHDAPDFAPPNIPLDDVLAERYGPQVPRVIRALQAEHLALDGHNPRIQVDDGPVLLASTADKIVALRSLLHRAQATGDVAGFFAARPLLVGLLPHFRDFQAAGLGRVPTSMSRHLAAVLTALARAAA